MLTILYKTVMLSVYCIHTNRPHHRSYMSVSLSIT